MSKNPGPSRPLTSAEARRCVAWLEPPRTLCGCWAVGNTIAKAMGRPRAEYAKGSLRAYAKQLGTTEDVLRHLLRLGRAWDEKEVKTADRAGLGFRCCQALLVLDTRGKSDQRRRLVKDFVQGRLDRTGLLRKVRAAKAAGADRLQPGPRLRSLLDVRRAVDGRLKQALARLDVDPGLWPRAVRPKARKLKARLKQAHEELEALYGAAAAQLRKK